MPLTASRSERGRESDSSDWWPAVAAFELTPLRITVVYLTLALFALYLSDVVFVRYLPEPLLSQVQATKAAVEVLLTAGLIFGLTRRSHRQLAAKHGQLERQNEELQLLHRLLRHNLRNKLNVVELAAEMLRDSADGAARERCDEILDTTAKLTEYVDRARRIRDVTEDDARSRRLDLSTAIPRSIDRPGDDAVDLTVTAPPDAAVLADPAVTDAVRELVENAAEHGGDGPLTVRVEVDPEAGPSGFTEVRVVDDGPGIPETELEALRAGRETPLHHPSGMGLWFVDWVVRNSDGDFLLDRNEMGGTTARVHLPDADE